MPLWAAVLLLGAGVWLAVYTRRQARTPTLGGALAKLPFTTRYNRAFHWMMSAAMISASVTALFGDVALLLSAFLVALTVTILTVRIVALVVTPDAFARKFGVLGVQGRDRSGEFGEPCRNSQP